MKNCIGICVCAVTMLIVSCGSTSFADIQAALPEMNSKADGVYRGNYDLSGTPIKVTVDVTVQSGTITTVDLVKHTRSPVGKKAEKITNEVIEKQSLNIDAVSGATASSKAILKAIENAFE